VTSGFVRAVSGDVAPDALGATNYHEHFFQVSPLLPGDELADEGASTQEARLLRASGFAAVVDATPYGLGRRPDALARVSAAAGITVVATAGRHRDDHYRDQPDALAGPASLWAGRFTRELLEWMPADDREPDGARAVGPDGAPVRAGVLKAGIDYWRITAAERTALEAVAEAHRATGAPIMVHTERCTAVDELLDILQGEGVASHRVVIAHADRTPDAGLHTAIAERGAYLGYDGAGRFKDWPDSTLIATCAAVVAAGRGDRILLGADVARARHYAAYGGIPGLAYLGERFVPRLRERIGAGAVNAILATNPASWLSWH
jgi:phosphotriesterase-related protein